jgi:protein ImuB
VVTAVLSGGRSADDQVRLVPWGDERVPARPAAGHTGPGPEPSPVQSLDAEATVIALAVAPGADRPTGGGLRLVPASAVEGPAGPEADQERQERTVGTAAPQMAGPVRRPVRKGPPLPPWPGRIPRPAPALVLSPPMGAVVLDADGTPVGVSARLELTGEPAGLLVENAAAVGITGWAGPWPVEERWWAPGEMRRRARFQAALADGRAVLLSLSGGHWAVEAIYD